MDDALDWMHLSEIAHDRINVKVLPNGKKAIVLRRGGTLRVFAESCPHLGADLSEAIYCPREGTLQCRWHGYVYSADSGEFASNPNEQVMALLRRPSQHFKPQSTPRYRLAALPFRVVGERLYFLRRDAAGASEGAS